MAPRICCRQYIRNVMRIVDMLYIVACYMVIIMM